MIYERFFKRLETCGGCTGLRNRMECRYALVCAYVEKLARKGAINGSKDFFHNREKEKAPAPTEAKEIIS